MAEWKGLVAAAGRGTRAGLPYPKTLFPIQGKPILVRILELLQPYDVQPTVVVSPDGHAPVQAVLSEHGRDAHLVEQPQAHGMGNAVLRWLASPAQVPGAHIILIWGDIPFIQADTLAATVAAHLAEDADLTFATRVVDAAYTVVTRDAHGRVTGLLETREEGLPVAAGERDIGLFIFKADVLLPLLAEPHPRRQGRSTGEHGFLYLVSAMAERGHKVQAVPVATELDLVSLNSMKDIDAYL
jgi:bifunctional UDP-N-acetylglucosamine pyrophosphorylase/glucosamine-1-phosphate N-acetyltransferase